MPIIDCAAAETAALADINDQPAMCELLRGADAVVHLAACTSDAPWPEQVRLSVVQDLWRRRVAGPAARAADGGTAGDNCRPVPQV